VLTLADIADAGDAEASECADDRLALRVKDLGLEDDVHDHASHNDSSTTTDNTTDNTIREFEPLRHRQPNRYTEPRRPRGFEVMCQQSLGKLGTCQSG